MATSLIDLNERLFRELDRLDSVDNNDVDALEHEIERAHAIKGIAAEIINNASVCVKAVQASMDIGEAVHIPKGLLNG